MEDWIRNLVAGWTGQLGQLARDVADRIASVYNQFTSALGRVRTGFGTWVARGIGWASASIRHAVAVALFLRYLMLSLLPAHIALAIDAAQRWAGQRVAELRDWTLGNLAVIRNWVVARVDELVASLVALYNWSVATVAAIRADIGRLFDRVFGILGTPERAAVWLVGALVPILVGYLAEHAAELGASLWGRRDQLLNQAVDQADELIDRIF